MTWRRFACLLALLLGVAAVAGGGTAAAAPLPEPVATPPVAVPPIGGTPCLPVVGCDPFGGLASGAADAVTKAVFNTFDAWVAEGATAVLSHVASAMSTSTKVQLNAAWFSDHFAAMRELAIVILLPLVLVGVIDAVIRRDASRLVKAVGVYLPLAVLAGFAAVELTDRALQVTDAMTSQVTGDLAADTDRAIKGLVIAIQALSTPVTPGVGGLLTVVVLLLVIAGAFLIWIELLLRSSAIYVVVLFLPIALSGLVWPATARWTRRLIGTLVALILSKFVIVAVISLAAGALGNVGGADKLDTLMSGAALLLLAAFAPFALLRLIPIVEAGAIAHLERLERRPLAAATKATITVASALMGGIEGAGGAAAAGAGSGGGPVAPPRMGGELNNVRAPGEAGGGPRSSGAGEGAAGAADRPPPTPPPSPPPPSPPSPGPVSAGPVSAVPGSPVLASPGRPSRRPGFGPPSAGSPSGLVGRTDDGA